MAIIKVILLAVMIMLLVVIGLALQTLFKKAGKFSNSHLGGNNYIKADGVRCEQTYDKMELTNARIELRLQQVLTDQSGIKNFC